MADPFAAIVAWWLNEELETRNQKLKTLNHEPETRNQSVNPKRNTGIRKAKSS